MILVRLKSLQCQRIEAPYSQCSLSYNAIANNMSPQTLGLILIRKAKVTSVQSPVSISKSSCTPELTP